MQMCKHSKKQRYANETHRAQNAHKNTTNDNRKKNNNEVNDALICKKKKKSRNKSQSQQQQQQHQQQQERKEATDSVGPTGKQRQQQLPEEATTKQQWPEQERKPAPTMGVGTAQQQQLGMHAILQNTEGVRAQSEWNHEKRIQAQEG